MLTRIFCKMCMNGRQAFYIEADGEIYFLFEQSYRKTIKSYYGKGVSLEQSMKFANSKSFAVRNVMEKLPLYIKYIEKEYGISIFEKTKRKRGGKTSAKRKYTAVNDGYYISEEII